MKINPDAVAAFFDTMEEEELDELYENIGIAIDFLNQHSCTNQDQEVTDGLRKLEALLEEIRYTLPEDED
jgi:hypothetical protein